MTPTWRHRSSSLWYVVDPVTMEPIAPSQSLKNLSRKELPVVMATHGQSYLPDM
jgi:hypothetical protein